MRIARSIRRISHTGRVGGAVLAAGAMTATLLAAAPASAEQGPEDGVERPTLEALQTAAERQGVPLEQALDDHFAQQRTKLTLADEPDGPVSTPEVKVDDLTAAELEDLAFIADEEGIDLAEAIKRHGWQNRFIEVSEALDERFPDQASGAIKAEDGSSAWFGFKGEAPAEAVKLIESLPVKVTIQENRGFSELELEQAAATAHGQVMASADTEDATTVYDISAGRVQVEVQPKPSPQGGPALYKTVAPKVAGGFEVDVTLAADAGAPEDKYVRGGGTLYKKSGSSWVKQCTAGFNVISATGKYKRTSTAGHCVNKGNERLHKNHKAQGADGTVTKNVNSHQGQYGDLAYSNGGAKTVTRTFYHDSSKPRYATARGGRPAIGTSVCHFGWKTKKSCGTVKYRSVNTGGLKGLVCAGTYISAGGDSGGPWYNGGRAYGNHYGWVSKDGAKRSCFTPVSQFYSWTDSYRVWIK